MNEEKPRSDWRLIRHYVFLVFLVGLSFLLVPSLALIAFVVFSSYHFGEQHWHDKSGLQNGLMSLFYTVYGLFIFTQLFFLNPVETSTVVQDITGFALTTVHFETFFYIAVVALLGVAGYMFHKKTIRCRLFEELFLLLTFFIIFRVASLVWAFAIYFIFWHSMPSLIDQVKVLYGKPTASSIRSYLKSSVLYWVLALIGLAMSTYFFGNDKDLFLPIFFSFLAAITVPHVLVMRKILH